METKTLEQYFLAEMEALKAENKALRKKAEAVDEDIAHGVGTATPAHHGLVMYDIDRDALAIAVKGIADEFGSFDDWANNFDDYRIVGWATRAGVVSVDRVTAEYIVEVNVKRYGIVPPISANDAGGVADLDSPFGWGVWLDDDVDWLSDLAEAIQHEASRC